MMKYSISKAILGALLVMMVSVHSQNTEFDIQSFKHTKVPLTFERDAFAPTNNVNLVSTNSANSPKTYSVGRVLYSNPVKLWEGNTREAFFETTFTFKITKVDDDPADGLTFFIIPVNSTLPKGGEGGSLGIFDAVDGPIFAVEVDAYVNREWDPAERHIGIDINSKNSTATVNFEDGIFEEVALRIDYTVPPHVITVHAAYGTKSVEFKYTYNLKNLLPDTVQIGLSASTGGQVARFEVSKWHFRSTMLNTLYDNTESIHQVV